VPTICFCLIDYNCGILLYSTTSCSGAATSPASHRLRLVSLQCSWNAIQIFDTDIEVVPLPHASRNMAQASSTTSDDYQHSLPPLCFDKTYSLTAGDNDTLSTWSARSDDDMITRTGIAHGNEACKIGSGSRRCYYDRYGVLRCYGVLATSPALCPTNYYTISTGTGTVGNKTITTGFCCPTYVKNVILAASDTKNHQKLHRVEYRKYRRTLRSYEYGVSCIDQRHHHHHHHDDASC
jgi:hypothetical protein